MKKAWKDVKSFISIVLSIAMVIILFVPYDINKEILMIFSSAYGIIMTDIFSKKNDEKE